MREEGEDKSVIEETRLTAKDIKLQMDTRYELDRTQRGGRARDHREGQGHAQYYKTHKAIRNSHLIIGRAWGRERVKSTVQALCLTTNHTQPYVIATL